MMIVITIDARNSSVFAGGLETAIPDVRRKKAPTVLDNEGYLMMIYWALRLLETLRQRDGRTFQRCDQNWVQQRLSGTVPTTQVANYPSIQAHILLLDVPLTY